jgi:signal transduction histidine kinase
MKTLRTLITINAVLFLVLGAAIAIIPDVLRTSYYQTPREFPLLRLAGLVLGAFGVVLLPLRGLALPEERRRLASRLSIADLLVSLVGLLAALQGVAWGPFLCGFPVMLAAGLAWTARPGIRGEEAAEALPVPEEVRQGWLRQVGETAVQEERNRLARDLHDSIKQQLFTINLSTAAAQERWEKDPEGARTALADVRRSAREASVELQALLQQLRPRPLTSTGLVEALREQCEALGYRTGAEVVVEMGESIPDDRLTPGTQEALFRIAQEMLANVARHARAQRVRVWIGREGESVRLQVADNGQGFEPGRQVSGMGMRNLRQRTEALHGTLDVDSAPGTGATIAVRIPLTSPPPKPSPIETAAAVEEVGTVISLMMALLGLLVVRPLLTSDAFGNVLQCILFISITLSAALSSGRRTQSALGSSSSATPASSARLRYLSYRNRALAFFLAAGWTPWPWRLGKIWSGWTAVWLGAALLCAGMAVVSLVRLHRATEVRSRWWRGFRPGGAAWILFLVFVFYAGMMALLLWQQTLEYPRIKFSFWPRPLGNSEILFLLLGMALLVYIRSRQPRAEGAAP